VPQKKKKRGLRIRICDVQNTHKGHDLITKAHPPLRHPVITVGMSVMSGSVLGDGQQREKILDLDVYSLEGNDKRPQQSSNSSPTKIRKNINK
jgi:hypothetical protein